jgi:hypothetical protein
VGIHIAVTGPITVNVVEDGDEDTRAALVRIEAAIVEVNRKAGQSNVNEAESLALLGEINAQSTADSAKLSTVVTSLGNIDTDLDALIALAQRPDVPPALAEGLTALKASLAANSGTIAEVESTTAALAAAYEPPATPTTPEGEVPGSTPTDGGTGDGGTGDGGAGGTGDGGTPTP